jgi:hypothetical protein
LPAVADVDAGKVELEVVLELTEVDEAIGLEDTGGAMDELAVETNDDCKLDVSRGNNVTRLEKLTTREAGHEKVDKNFTALPEAKKEETKALREKLTDEELIEWLALS